MSLRRLQLQQQKSFAGQGPHFFNLQRRKYRHPTGSLASLRAEDHRPAYGLLQAHSQRRRNLSIPINPQPLSERPQQLLKKYSEVKNIQKNRRQRLNTIGDDRALKKKSDLIIGNDPTLIKERLRVDVANQYLHKRGRNGIKQSIKQSSSNSLIKDFVTINIQLGKSNKNNLSQKKNIDEEMEKKEKNISESKRLKCDVIQQLRRQSVIKISQTPNIIDQFREEGKEKRFQAYVKNITKLKDSKKMIIMKRGKSKYSPSKQNLPSSNLDYPLPLEDFQCSSICRRSKNSFVSENSNYSFVKEIVMNGQKNQIQAKLQKSKSKKLKNIGKSKLKFPPDFF